MREETSLGKGSSVCSVSFYSFDGEFSGFGFSSFATETEMRQKKSGRGVCQYG